MTDHETRDDRETFEITRHQSRSVWTSQDTWWRWLRRSALGLLIGFVVVATAYNSFRIGQVYKNSEDVARIQSEMTALRNVHEAAIHDANARLDQIEKTLFGEVVAKIEKVPLSTRASSQVQLWQENRDKELRERINRLERWRAQMGESK